MAWIAHLLATALGLLALQRLVAGTTMRGWHKAIVAAGIVVLALAGFRASDPPAGFLFSDFSIAYYPAGLAALQDPQRLEGLLQMGVRGFVNLPAVAWLFAPLALVPERIAVVVFTALGVAACVAAWWLLCRVARLEVRERCMLALLFAANGPLLYSVKEGNTSHMVLFGVVAAFALLKAGRHVAAGALLATCAVIKPPLALFGLFFLLRRDVAGLVAFILVGAGFVVTSLLLAGWTLNLDWFQLSVVKFSREWLAAFNVQSLPAFVLRLDSGAQQHLHDWTTPTAISAGERLAGQLLEAAVLAAAAFAWLRADGGGSEPGQAERRCDLQFLLVLCLALVASPLSWSHYYAWLLMPTAFFLAQNRLRDGRAAQVLGWIAVFLATPLVRPLFVDDAALMAAYRALGVSHLLFGGLLMFALVAAHLAAAGPAPRRGRARSANKRRAAVGSGPGGGW
ncbi:glycosyltransferase family 87 protein [Ramlibacter sp. MMS24-I3-19]|uniref:glycosyltransferase family 87 protein n=1 Tax=Ramlibacter sp. MMS24-I3-19 TaxID=3416606 RepID=UPI003CFCF749